MVLEHVGERLHGREAPVIDRRARPVEDDRFNHATPPLALRCDELAEDARHVEDVRQVDLADGADAEGVAVRELPRVDDVPARLDVVVHLCGR